MRIEHNLTTKGRVECIVNYKDGNTTKTSTHNTVLRNGKIAIANGLAREINDPFDFYIDEMIFGTNGTSGGTPKFVEESRSGLFSSILLSKSVISSIDAAAPTTAIFTAVVGYDEAVGSDLNEMALVMANGDLYSMTTFPDLGKTSDMQLTFNWYLSIL